MRGFLIALVLGSGSAWANSPGSGTNSADCTASRITFTSGGPIAGVTSTAGCTGPNDVIAKRDFDQDLYAPAGAASCCFVSPSGPASTFALIGYTQPTTLLAGDDCEDTVSGTNPGATEICDAADNDEDCDTLADDADSSVSAATKTTWYADTDSDTWGSSTSQSLCNQPSGHVARSGDCIDGDASVYPGVAELQGSGGVACSTVSGSSTAPFLLACCMEDDDADGWGDGTPPANATAGNDCDDSDIGIYPGVAETERSGATLCSTATFSSASLLLTTCCMADADADGWGDATNSASRSEGNDCNDADSTAFPGSAELEYNTAKTVACSTVTGASTASLLGQCCMDDNDGDGWGETGTTGGQTAGNDCNDTDNTVYPGIAGLERNGSGTLCSTVTGSSSNSLMTACCMSDSDNDNWGESASTGGQTAGNDCDDNSVNTFPGSGENETLSAGTILCSSASAGTLNTANLLACCMLDGDADGYGDDTLAAGRSDGSDCNDSIQSINPVATEILDDGVDQNCSGGDLCVEDLDRDGDGSITATVVSADLDCTDAGEARSINRDDCNDTNPLISTHATEVCDSANVDEDCDNQSDNSDSSTDASTKSVFYVDADNDNYGVNGTATLFCDEPAGYATVAGDCNDGNLSTFPGAAQTESATACMQDIDNDGWGSRTPVAGATAGTDCNDNNIGQVGDQDGDGYATCDGDCNDTPVTGINFDVDNDGDTYDECDGDCNDANPLIYPTVTETIADGVDQDCNGTEICYVDSDGDGYANSTGITVTSTDADCTDPGEASRTLSRTDCNDSNSAISPAATEIDDNIDNDCDLLIDEGFDLDGDGYTPLADSDCNDSNATIYPGAPTLCDGLINACGGTLAATEVDNDGDLFVECTPWVGANTRQGGDCDDTAINTFPGAAQNQSATSCMNDDDNDGYGDISPPSGVTVGADCDDADVAVTVAPDVDGDTYVICANAVIANEDCDDNDPNTHPFAGTHEASNQAACRTDLDGDGYGATTAPAGGSAGTDCDDSLATTFPGAAQAESSILCMADLDNDGWGSTTAPAGGSAGTDCNDSIALLNRDDVDGDTFATCPNGQNLSDCDDSGADTFPGAAQLESVTSCRKDADGDGYGDEGSGPWVAGTDCDDDVLTGALTFMGSADFDAISLCTRDNDQDGWGDRTPGTVAIDAGGDCDDSDPVINPEDNDGDGASPCGGDCNDTDIHVGIASLDVNIDLNADSVVDCNIDTNADGTVDIDTDGDGYADNDACCMADADGDEWGARSGATGIDPGNDCDDTDSLQDGSDRDADGFTGCEGDCNDNDASLEPADADQDGYSTCQNDCDDGVRAIFPGAAQDELTSSTCSKDTDDDGWGDRGSGIWTAGTDCDDTDATQNFDDEDGDGSTTCPDSFGLIDCDDSLSTGVNTGPAAASFEDPLICSRDNDGDGWGDDGTGVFDPGSDCDDTDANVNPDIIEICDGIDNNCDGVIDETSAGDAATWYLDTDGDGFGDLAHPTPDCSQPVGYVSNSLDCDDAAPAVNPSATEVCDTIDNDCDGQLDEDSAANALTWYLDSDGDSYGDPALSNISCRPPTSYVADNTDCNDASATVHPTAPETCNLNDDNCNGILDENSVDATTWYVDSDGDGYGNRTFFQITCTAPSGYVPEANSQPGPQDDDYDCNDNDVTIHPYSVVCDGLDNDCDSSTPIDPLEIDNDNDTFVECTGWSGASGIQSGDCDDTSNRVNPLAVEVCDGIDNNCDTVLPPDEANLDGDQFVSCASWVGAANTVVNGVAILGGNDCIDTPAADVNSDGIYESYLGLDVYPGAPEECDGKFNDCTDPDFNNLPAPLAETDNDGDGYVECDDGLTGSFGTDVNNPWEGIGGVSGDLDCDDNDANIVPDSLGGGDCEVDNDSDGYPAYSYDGSTGTLQPTGQDCDDTRPDVNIGALETCEAEDEVQIDNDCDGNPNTQGDLPVSDGGRQLYHDDDNDAYGDLNSSPEWVCVAGNGFTAVPGDCNDANFSINPDAPEQCNGVDDDCDLQTDETQAGENPFGCDIRYLDLDGDGYGNAATETCLCPDGDEGYVDVAGDCDDYNGNVHPLTPEDANQEVLDGHDSDCDGLVPVIELDCDDDGSFALLPGGLNGLDKPKIDADLVGMPNCKDNQDPENLSRPFTCWGLAVSAVCDQETGLWSLDRALSTDGYGGRFQEGRRLYTTGSTCTRGYAGDCDDQCAMRCEGHTEVCDGVDNDCAGTVAASSDFLPSSMDLEAEVEGAVRLAEVDFDLDGFLSCNSYSLNDPEVVYTSASCAEAVLDPTTQIDCNNACGLSSPVGEERCDGFTNLCDGPPEGTDDDGDGHRTCGTGSVPGGDELPEDIYVLSWFPEVVDTGTDSGDSPTESDDGVVRSYVPLLLPRANAPECDLPLWAGLAQLPYRYPDRARICLDAQAYGAAADIEACLAADPPEGFPPPQTAAEALQQIWLAEVCDMGQGESCRIVRITLAADVDAELLEAPSEAVSPACLEHPEQAIARTVWSSERILEARNLVVEAQCVEVYGKACSEVKPSAMRHIPRRYEALPSHEEALSDDQRWWKEMGRFSPTLYLGGTLGWCWGEARQDAGERSTAVGGDCADGTAKASRDLPEGPDDLLWRYYSSIADYPEDPDCGRCLDAIDNNCDGQADCLDPSCAVCFVGQGSGCAAEGSPCAGGNCSASPVTGPEGAAAGLGVLLLASAVARRKKQG